MGLEPNGSATRSARAIAILGPYLSGKTTLLEAILARTGAATRQGEPGAERRDGREG